MLDEIVNLFGGSGAWPLWGPFLLLIACGVGLPLPEDVILVAAGFLGAESNAHLLTTCTLMYFGIIIGDFLIFTMGLRFGPRILNSRLGRWIMGEDRQARAQELFHKYGNSVILVARFLPGLRAPTYLTAGMLRYPRWKFVIFDGLAALVSAPIFVWIGHWAYGRYAENTDLLKGEMGRVKLIVLLCGLLLGLAAFLFVKRRARKQQLATQVEAGVASKSTVD